jgi:hypothetical protein
MNNRTVTSLVAEPRKDERRTDSKAESKAGSKAFMLKDRLKLDV